MKNSKAAQKVLIAILAILIINITFASTYTTISDGNWENDTYVWSVDGQTPCKCSPGRNTNGNDIFINNNIRTSYDVIINKSDFLVSKNGSLTGSYSVFASDAIIDFNGKIELAKYVQDANTIFNMTNKGVLNISQECSILDGEFNITSSIMYLTSGSFNIGNCATVSLENNAHIFIEFGNVNNHGDILAESDCSMSGMFENYLILAQKK